MSEHLVRDKSFAFALRVVKLPASPENHCAPIKTPPAS